MLENGGISEPDIINSDKADQYTCKDHCYTDGHAPKQVFHFKRLGFSYGTDDKVHAAALILSFFLLLLIAFIFICGAIIEGLITTALHPGERILWIPEILKTLGSAFLLTAGIAVGKSTN